METILKCSFLWQYDERSARLDSQQRKPCKTSGAGCSGSAGEFLESKWETPQSVGHSPEHAQGEAAAELRA